MRKENYLILLIGFTILVIFSACKKEEKYPELTLGFSNAPTATFKHITDSLNETYTYISFISNANGHIHYVALQAGNDIPSVPDIILGNTIPEALTVAVTANDTGIVKIQELTPRITYDLYAVATNATEGKSGELIGPISFTCPDNTIPTLLSMTPASGAEGVSVALDSIVLTFSENVNVAHAEKVVLLDVESSQPFPISEIVCNGTEAVIVLQDSLPYSTMFGLIVNPGAFIDIEGNPNQLHYLVDTSYQFYFATEDFIDVTFNTNIFNGVYRCVATDKYYDKNLEYDVLIKDSVALGGYYLKIINFHDSYPGVATLQLYPDGDTAHFADWYTGIIDPTYGELYVGEYYGSTYSTPEFYRGSFERDGSILKAWGEVFNGDYSYWYGYELTFTKY